MPTDYRNGLATRVKRMVASGLVPGDQPVKMFRAKPVHGQVAQWHLSADCRVKRIRDERVLTITELHELLQTPADQDSDDKLKSGTWCWCSEELITLPTQWGWSDYEREAYRRWSNAYLVLNKADTGKRDIHSINATYDELLAEYRQEVTGDKIVDRIPTVHAAIRAELESRLWDEAAKEGERHAPRLAEKARRAAQREEERAAAEAAGLRYVPQPFGTLIDALHELVDAGVPPETIHHCLMPLAVEAEIAESGANLGHAMRLYRTDDSGPRSEGYYLFIEELRAVPPTNSDRRGRRGRRHGFPHPMAPYGEPGFCRPGFFGH